MTSALPLKKGFRHVPLTALLPCYLNQHGRGRGTELRLDAAATAGDDGDANQILTDTSILPPLCSYRERRPIDRRRLLLAGRSHRSRSRDSDDGRNARQRSALPEHV